MRGGGVPSGAGEEWGAQGEGSSPTPSRGPVPRGSHQGQCGRLGEAGMKGSQVQHPLSLLGGRGEGRALGARRRANQEELLPRRPQRSWWWGGGKSQGVGVTWLRGPEPRQDLLRQRLLCPWLLSQGQTFPGLQGHHSAGEGRQVGAIPMPWSPTARGLASGSQSKGWELCQWRGRGARRARPTPMSASSLLRAFRASWARPALPYTSCVALGRGTSCALCKSLCKGAGKLQFKQHSSHAHSEGAEPSLESITLLCTLAAAWGTPS